MKGTLSSVYTRTTLGRGRIYGEEEEGEHRMETKCVYVCVRVVCIGQVFPTTDSVVEVVAVVVAVSVAVALAVAGGERMVACTIRHFASSRAL